MSKVLESFDASLKRRHIVNRTTIMSTLRRGLAPLLKREIDTLDRKEIVERIDALEAEGKPGAAQDLRKHTRSLLEFAVSKGLTRYNVLAGMRRPRASRAERLKDVQKGRALPDDQINALWSSAASLGPLGGLLRLALLTGLRRSELSGLKWSDIRDDRIVIAAERAKTGESHAAPLTIAMRTVLSAQPRTTSQLVFPGRGNARLAGWSKMIPRAQRESGVDFRLHDLRRTVANPNVAARRCGGCGGAGDRPCQTSDWSGLTTRIKPGRRGSTLSGASAITLPQSSLSRTTRPHPLSRSRRAAGH